MANKHIKRCLFNHYGNTYENHNELLLKHTAVFVLYSFKYKNLTKLRQESL